MSSRSISRIRPIFHIHKKNIASTSSETKLNDLIYETLSQEWVQMETLMEQKQVHLNLRKSLIHYICENNPKSLVSIAVSEMQGPNKKFVKHDDEISITVLKFLSACLLQQNTHSADFDGIDIATTSFHNDHYRKENFHSEMINYLKTLSVNQKRSNGFKIAFALALKRLKDVSAKREDLDPRDIFQIESKLTSIMKGWAYHPTTLLFSNEELREVEEFLQPQRLKKFSKLKSVGYDPKLTLVSDLLLKNELSNYSSPFLISETEQCKSNILFMEQLNAEENGFIAIKDSLRTSRERHSFDDLIEEWEWSTKISEAVKEIPEDDSEFFSLIRKIGTDGTVKKIMEILYWAVCKAEGYLIYVDFQRALSTAIYSAYYNDFLQTLSINHRSTLLTVYNEYIRYFTEENLSKDYTMRQWWSECTSRMGLKEEFSPHFSQFFTNPPPEVADKMIDIIVEACTFKKTKETKHFTQAFSIGTLTLQMKHPLEVDDNEEKINKLVKVFHFHPDLRELIIRYQTENIIFPTNLLPMKVPPRPWTSVYSSQGHNGPLYTQSQPVLRELEEYPMSVNDELKKVLGVDRKQARPYFDALNNLGGTPWIISPVMLDHLKTVYRISLKPEGAQEEALLKKLSIPLHPDCIPKPQLEKYKDNQALQRAYYGYWKRRDEANSLWCFLKYKLILAQHFAGNFLFFPHNMDFRGRVYPISPHLNHMGDDINRSLLKFARGKPLGRDGFHWLKLHCISITGKYNRESFQSRLRHFEDKYDLIIESAKNPFKLEGLQNNTTDGGSDPAEFKWQWWVDSDDPWQTLAACIELRNAMESGDPYNHISHLPIHQDGSCNGLQHYAALGKDFEGAKSVNLVPSDVPQDVYSDVAEGVEKLRLADEKNPESENNSVALELREALPVPMPRKVIKQTVMTKVYGVTQWGARKQIKRQLLDRGIRKDKVFPFAFYIADCTFKIMATLFKNSMVFKEWFCNCALYASRLHQPVRWITPLGFPVVQPYLDKKQVGKFICLLPSRFKQKNAFPPNFIHSLDSTHMMLTALHCHRRGLTYAAVHDCYWTHACDVDEMNRICREQFVALYSQEPSIVAQLSDYLKAEYLPERLREHMRPAQLELFEQKFGCEHLSFGQLDIENVKNSTYFFS